jgi:O-antigen ligase
MNNRRGRTVDAALLTAILWVGVMWFGILSLRAAESIRWLLTAFELALFALAAALIVRRRLAIRPHPIAVLLAIAALWALAQVWLGISVDPQRTLQAALGWTVNCAAFSVTLAICSRDETRRRFLTAQVLFAVVLSIASILSLYTVSILGPFVYKNQFAAYLESVIGIAITFGIRDPRRRLTWILVAGTMFASVVAAGSRAGSILCLALLVALPVTACLRGWISAPSLARIAAVAIASGAILVLVTGWETTWERLQEPNPYSLRADLLRSSVAMARDRPLTGFGLGAWSSAYPGYARFDDGNFVNQAHNDWAQWAAEGGFPFLALMLAVVALLVRPALASLWGLGLIAVFIHAWIDYPFEQRPALAAFLFAMAGALAAETTASPSARRPDEFSRP